MYIKTKSKNLYCLSGVKKKNETMRPWHTLICLNFVALYFSLGFFKIAFFSVILFF